jgi:hypothetical protein
MCTICKYNQVRDIDRALLSGASLASISKNYSFSIPDLLHHRKHLRQRMALAEKRFHHGLHQGLFCKLNLVMEMVLAVIQGARAGEDFKLFLQATREFSRLVSLMHKMDISLDPEMIYCLMDSPQWDLQEGKFLPYAFQALDKTRQSLKRNLFSHCPDPDSEPEPELVESCFLETQGPKLETSITRSGTRHRRRTRALETLPKNKREISAKLE